MTWGDWSATWDWVERAAAYDAAIEREKLNAFKGEQIEAARRHARAIQASISALIIPVKIALETAATPAGLLELKTAALASTTGLRAALADARVSAAAIPALVQAERLTLGMNTEHHEVSEFPAVDPVAMRIATDPAATELAQRLLTLIAKERSEQ